MNGAIQRGVRIAMNLERLEQIRAASQKAVLRFEEWQNADGIFPEPQYDHFLSAMDELADLVYGDGMSILRGDAG